MTFLTLYSVQINDSGGASPVFPDNIKHKE
jgi:hypothetical protein